MSKKILSMAVFLFVISLVTFANVLCAEETNVSETTPIAPGTQIQPVYVFGEVVSVTPEVNEITVQYYDYEANELKEMKLAFDSNTKLENFQAISEIAVGDTVNVEYNVAEGKNLVQNISVEKMETEEPINESLDSESQETEIKEQDAVTQPQTN